MNDLILALDFGGTKLSAALFGQETSDKEREEDLTQRREDRKEEKNASWRSLRPWRPLREVLPIYSLFDLRRVFTPSDADAEHELAAMLAIAHELLAGRAPAAVGVSFGGPVDYKAGLVRLSHHVRGWENTPLREALEREFGAPAAVDNDANVAALGEHRFGAGRGVEDLMYITVSTGVGGGWILGGRPWRGHGGMAGEIGHTVVDPAGPLCLCGKRGCVERLASGPYMAADFMARGGKEEQGSRGAGEQGREDHGRQTTDHGLSAFRDPSSVVRRPLTGQDVAEAAAAGDLVAMEILLRGAWALGVGIGNAANLINPQRFILGGGVTKAGEAWWAEVRAAAHATALPEVRFDVVPAELGDDAPLWGALALATDRCKL
jgi:glucokinase